MEAMFWKKEGNAIECQLCPQNCRLCKGGTGTCRARKNVGGKLVALTYSRPCSLAIDPIEKKPLYHFMPGSRVLSIATTGCNLKCRFCQNWEIAQADFDDIPNERISPEEIVNKAVETKCCGIAYTYTEPTVFYEYSLDIAKLAKKKGLFNVFVTNGVINKEPLKKIAGYIDAANIDLKGFTGEYYKRVCGGKLEWVKKSIKWYREIGIHVEITNLIVPSFGDFVGNDNIGNIKKMCEWIKKEIGAETPVHFSRFFPMYKLKHLIPTPVETLMKAREAAMDAGLKHIYIGNVMGQDLDNTLCSKCSEVLVRRTGYIITDNKIEKGKCPKCGKLINGKFKPDQVKN